MKGIINFARGRVGVLIRGGFPERLVNLCAQRRVTFWGVEWLSEASLRMSLLRRDLPQLEELAPRAGCTVEVERREGLPFFLARFRRRYAFLAGLALSVAAVAALSNVVLTVEVTGNTALPDRVILSQLARLGLRPGAYGPGLDTRQIALEAQLELEGISWLTVNLYGTRAQVVVREEIPAPELLEEEGVCDITARAGGLITDIKVLEGQALVEAGDTVAAGEVLISGTVALEGPQYSGIPTRYMAVRADGIVWARTWRTVTASIPLTAQTKAYTGEEITRWSLTVLGRRMNFYGNGSISWPCYDKISRTDTLTLPGGQRLPLSLTRETLRQWEPAQAELDAAAARELLEEQLLSRLERLVGEEGEVVDVAWSASTQGDTLTVTAQAECLEQIGRESPARNIIGGGEAAG